MLGRGGMGEVYRADDLVLEQVVALKFLRPEISADPASRNRFRSEVKLAREVTHPNVCRVHDVGDLDGLLYLSMEYVDGEDLSALLRRIGAPSGKKALEIAGQLCAGLAAAHARGVLHRDLKPANVMIDGAGKVRITDFGLAILEKDELERGLAAGTPAYMAPEQLVGGEATPRSDVYALGLVLYELFTGVRVWIANDLGQLRNEHATRPPEPPSAHAQGLDERIERTILSCLERDPGRRPRSPTSVAAALTGADPLAAALAAGETPTPEMVAASGGEGTISMMVACTAVAAIFLLFAALVFIAPRASLYGHIALEDEPVVLAHRAREILQSVHLAVPEGDRAFGFETKRVQRLGREQPDAVFWYREAPFSLQPGRFYSGITPDDPPLHWPGMVSIQLSTRGKLERLEAVRAKSEDSARSETRCDWAPLFAGAGLALADFKPLEGQEFTPPQSWDERATWTGSDPREPGTERKVGGASFQGRPVFFALSPWTEPPESPDRTLDANNSAHIVRFWCWLLALIGGTALARRNWTRGSGDRRTALRLAVFVSLLDLAVVFLRVNHTTDVSVERALLVQGLSLALFDAGYSWVLYLALEPYVRRIWPDHLVSWSRLFAGRWRDPLVARDLLVGLGAGILGTIAGFAQVSIGMSLDAPRVMYVMRNFPETPGLRTTIAQFCSAANDGVAGSFIVLFSLVALRFVVRRDWITYILIVPMMLSANVYANPTGLQVLDWAVTLPFVALVLFLLARFGVFAVAVFIASSNLLNTIPLTGELGAWYVGPTILAGLVIGGIALAAAHFAIGKRVQFS